MRNTGAGSARGRHDGVASPSRRQSEDGRQDAGNTWVPQTLAVLFNVRFGALHHDSARRRMEVFAKFGCQISANATSPFRRDSCQKAGRALQPQSCKHDNPTRLIFSNLEARRISNDDTHRHDPNGTNFTPYPRMPPRPCSSVRSHRAWPCSCHCSRAPPSPPPTKPRRKVSIWS